MQNADRASARVFISSTLRCAPPHAWLVYTHTHTHTWVDARSSHRIANGKPCAHARENLSACGRVACACSRAGSRAGSRPAADHTSSLDCSCQCSRSFHSLVACAAWPSRRPARSKTAARTDDVPMSTPITASRSPVGAAISGGERPPAADARANYTSKAAIRERGQKRWKCCGQGEAYFTAAAPYLFYETSLLDFSNETKRQVPCALEPCPAPKGPRPRRAERASCTPVSSRCVCTARLRRAGPGVRALWCILASRRLLPGVGARM